MVFPQPIPDTHANSPRLAESTEPAQVQAKRVPALKEEVRHEFPPLTQKLSLIIIFLSRKNSFIQWSFTSYLDHT